MLASTSQTASSPAPSPSLTTARPAQRQASSYAELARQVRSAGLMDRRRGYYAARIGTALVALAGVVTGIVLMGNSWLQLLLAGALAVVLTQCAFLGHDGAHRQMFATRPGNEWVGRLFAGLLVGLSFGWWMGKHSRHHRAPNQIGADSDIESKVLSLTEDAVRSRRGVLRWVARHQGWLFFPLLLLEGANLHVDSLSLVTRRRPVQRRWVDITLIAVHWCGYLTFLLVLLPPGKAAAFLGVHMAIFGLYLGAAFAPNHIGMPIMPKAARLDFLDRQVLMSRNVSGGAPVSFLMGGLNYQVEHHLFPNMPRPNLRRARPLVRAFCAEHDVQYTETTLFGAYRAVVTYLNAVGLQATDPVTCPLARQLGR